MSHAVYLIHFIANPGTGNTFKSAQVNAAANDAAKLLSTTISSQNRELPALTTSVPSVILPKICLPQLQGPFKVLYLPQLEVPCGVPTPRGPTKQHRTTKHLLLDTPAENMPYNNSAIAPSEEVTGVATLPCKPYNLTSLQSLYLV